jgi:tetratricopeptide (TPR) repeat protein
MDEPQENQSRLRLTESGHRRLSQHFPKELKRWALYVHIARKNGIGIRQNTICRILERQQPVSYVSIAKLYKAYGLDIHPPDYEPFPTARRSASEHYHVPRERSECFTGRANELKTLRALLLRDKVVAISGLGGIGKTQTALAYCDLHKEKYKCVFWIRAESDADVQQGYVQIALQLNLPGAALSEQERAAAARQWLEQHSGWLLVLDNLDKPESETPYFPGEPNGHILITTRLERLNLPDVKASFPLKTLSPSESLDFLLHRCRRKETTAAERAAAAKLAEHLGHLPLAMAQAAAYIENITTFANYLALYEKRNLAQLEKRAPGAKDTHTPVSMTWEINFQALEEETRWAQTAGKYAPQLLRFSAFLAPDDIPIEMVKRGAKEYCPDLHALFENAEDEAEAEEAYNEALEPLTRYSLTARKMEDHSFSLHRLVQAVTRDRLPEAERQAWKERVVRAVSNAFPYPEFENWKLCERLLPHAIVVGEMIRQDNMRTEAAGQLLDNVGRYLYERGRYPLAEPCCLSALDVWRTVHTEAHPSFATSINNLALLCHVQGRCEEAETHYNRALAIRRQHFSDDHLDVAECLNNLAEMYSSQGLSEKAEPLLVQTLEIAQKARPQADRYFATVLQNLALLCYRQKRYDEAERHYTQARAISRECLSPNDPQLATCLHNMAQLYRRQSRIEEAKPLYLEALAIQEEAYPDGHPDTSITHHNLAAMYEGLGCHDKAGEHYKQALETSRKAFGEEHADVVFDRQTLAAFYKKWGRDRKV